MRNPLPGQPDKKIGTGFIDESGLTQALRERIQELVKMKRTFLLEDPETAPVAVHGEPPASGLFSFDKYSSAPVLIDAIRDDIGRARGEDTNRSLFLVPKAHVTKLHTGNGPVDRLEVFVDNQVRMLRVPPSCKVISR